jgi:hypothetical protein
MPPDERRFCRSRRVQPSSEAKRNLPLSETGSPADAGQSRAATGVRPTYVPRNWAPGRARNEPSRSAERPRSPLFTGPRGRSQATTAGRS